MNSKLRKRLWAIRNEYAEEYWLADDLVTTLTFPSKRAAESYVNNERAKDEIEFDAQEAHVVIFKEEKKVIRTVKYRMNEWTESTKVEVPVPDYVPDGVARLLARCLDWKFETVEIDDQKPAN